MVIFEFNDYRTAVKTLVRERKKVDTQFTFDRLATRIRVQKPYLSKVLSQKAHFSSDQLYLALEYLDLKDEQKDFLTLLFELNRTSLKERQKELQLEVNKIRENQNQSEKYLQATTVNSEADSLGLYYLEPLHQLIHVFLSIERFQKKPELIAEALGVTRTRIFECIHNLEKMDVLESTGKGIELKQRNFHLPNTSTLYPSWRERVRIFNLQRIQATETDKQYNFAMTFSADQKTYVKIQKKFLDFLKEADAEIKAAPYEHIFQLTFDLVPLTKI